MTAITEQDRATAPSGFWVLLTCSLVSSLIMLDSNIVAVSLPAIGRAIGASFTDIQWVISAYVLTYASLLLASGNYADLYGRRKAMVIGLLVFGLASVGCGLATTPTLLNVARGIQGVGGALLLTASLAIISDAFKGTERTRAYAFWGASLGIALAVGPIVGGVIASTIGWRWVFLMNIPACAILTQHNAVTGYLLTIFGIGAFGWLLFGALQSPKIERERLFVVFVLTFFSMMFWSFFEARRYVVTTMRRWLEHQSPFDRNGPTGAGALARA